MYEFEISISKPNEYVGEKSGSVGIVIFLVSSSGSMGVHVLGIGSSEEREELSDNILGLTHLFDHNRPHFHLFKRLR
jgi:NADPH-dependent curcumin reductase CurA